MQPSMNASLMEQILAPGNVREAIKHVKANRGCPGVDGMPCEAYEGWATEHWAGVCMALENGTYGPEPALRVEIPKSNGGVRNLGIPTVRDRVIQQSILQVLTPVFDPGFSESSFGFRLNRSAHGAIKQVRELVEAGYRWVVDLDIEKFFDTVDHDILMSRVARKISDKTLLRLIGRYLRAGVEVKGQVQPTMQGTPQGGPLSPLLANVYLDDVDKELESRGLHFVRYADDLMILVKSQRAGERVMASITHWLEKHLKLKVNRDKSAVRKADGVEYLGFQLKGKNKVRIRWSADSLREFKDQVKKLTRRSWSVSMKYRMAKLGQYIRGWMQYYGMSEYYRPISELDEWLRRRVRMCYLKQWRLRKTRIKKLISLGVGKGKAIHFAYIEKGWWYLSGLYAAQWGMSNKWLAEQCLVSIRDLWIKIHYPDTPRLSFASLK